MTGRIALIARDRVSLRSVLLAATLSVAIAFGLLQGVRLLAGAGSSSSPLSGSAAGQLSSLSPSARASLSASIGAEDPAYHFSSSSTGFQGSNESQQLGIASAGSEVRLSARGLTLGLSLQRIAYDGSWRAVGEPRVSVAANRLTYSSPGVSAWYVNGPLELEQGFTLARPGGQVAPSSVALGLAMSGNAHAVLSAGGRGVRFVDAHGRVLRYGRLSVLDAGGRTLASHLEVAGGQLLVRIDARGARFPLRVDPAVEVEREVAESKLGRSGSEAERAGLSVALSADGSTAVVGAPDGDMAGGAVWVFRRSHTEPEVGKPVFGEGEELLSPKPEGNSAECLEGTEILNEGNQCGFGRSVAVSANGETILVGAPAQGGEGNAEGETEEEVGAAWVFTHSQSGWEHVELPSPKPAGGGHFGRGVALSASGETALVGAPGENGNHGRAWVFTLVGGTWQSPSEPLLPGGEGGSGRFGESVALSGDGETALVGGPANDGLIGAVWVFKDVSGSWGETAKLDGRGLGGHFGYSVALSADASTALVGAPEGGSAVAAAPVGAAWVYQQSEEGTWGEPVELAGMGETDEQFGFSVGLSQTGGVAVVGAPFALMRHGTALVYERAGTSWSLARRLSDTPAEGKARFGKSASIAANGETMLVGGPAQSNGGLSHDEGAAWVFGSGPAVTGVVPSEGPQEGGTPVVIAGQHFTEASAVDFGTTPAASFEVVSSKEIKAFSPPGKGQVAISVQTPLGISEATKASGFTYIPPGGEDKDHSPGGSGSGNTPPNEILNTNNTTGSGSPQGAQQVLALGPVTGGACGALLSGSRIAVLAKIALVKIRRVGTGGCRGHVTLSVKVKMGGRGRHAKSKMKAIGTANFKLSGAGTVVVKVKLNAAGRALFKAAHGRLSAHVLVYKSLPSPAQAHTSTVRLIRQRPAKRRTKPKAT